jgi:hypothetical protein
LDERSTTAFSARTWGELEDLTGDLPAPAADGLAGGHVARRDETRLAWAPMIWICLIMLAAGVAGREVSGVTWVVAAVSIVPYFFFAARGTRKGRARPRLR